MNPMRIFVLAAVTGALLVTAACEDNRAITTEPVGDLGFGINLAREATNLPRGSIRFPATVQNVNPALDSLVVSLSGLDSLPAGTSYMVWVADDSSTTWFRARGARLQIFQSDTSINAVGDPVILNSNSLVTGVDRFSNGGSNRLQRFATSRAAITGLGIGQVGVGMVSIETTADPAQPSANRQIIWGRRIRRNGNIANVPANDSTFVRFGSFGRSEASEYVYSTTSIGRASVLQILPRGRVEVRGSILVINDSNYTRPPAGYYYAAYAVKFDTINARAADTAYLGRRTTPFPEQISLFNADFGSENPAPGIVLVPQNVILGMRTRVSADTIAIARANPPRRAWAEFGRVTVTLESKDGIEGRMGSAIIMQQILPQSIRGR